MQIAITSDIHNNEVNLEKVLRHCAEQKITTIICCGDLASKEVLDLMNDNFAGVIYYTFGNADYTELRELDSVEKYRNTFLFKSFGETKIDSKQIAFVHFPREARKLAETRKYDFVFHGHTHKPWEEMIGNCKILNPGNVAGEIYPPTFAIWNTENDNFKLIRVHNLK
ncbi:MAG: YfcE family phosphodiesterase [Candidatus Moraniibacteriota bacterium]